MWKKNKNPEENQDQPEAQNPEADSDITTQAFKQTFSASNDIIYNEVSISKAIKCSVVLVDGLVDSQMVDDFIIKPLIQEGTLKDTKSVQELIDNIMLGTVYHCQRKVRNKFSDCINDLLSGSAVLIFDDIKKAVTFEVKGFEKRSLTEPANENVLKGSKEAFIEVIRVNTALIRRRLPSPNLVISEKKIGLRSNTTVAIVYLDGVINKSIVEEVNNRLGQINIDGIVATGVIETNLLSIKYSFFPQFLYTERTDKFCGSIIEGRVGILVDGFPYALILPVDLNSFLQAPEDYSQNFIASSLFRILRYFSAFFALTLPAFYVSVTTFHQEMIPTKLAASIIQSKEGVPFSSYIEVVLMLLAFEVLLEAGLRLPKSIGQAVSIVGALVVGDAAITAKILSPAVVIVIASAGITGFVIPAQDMSNTIRICRLILVLFSAISGLYGLTIGIILIVYHLSSLEICGTPYLSPFVSAEGKSIFSDALIRKPWFLKKKRPIGLAPEDKIRQR